MKKILLLPGFLGLAVLVMANTEKPAAAIAKELIFPVSGKSNIGSYWGDSRDGGARKHEGIDIFASKGTPVVAVADGYVLEVIEDGIGGKSVTIQSDEYSWRSYYAHLDEQLVEEGQIVKKGQLVGRVGNTGNARSTPSHLHFGIYDENGAMDPLPYVKTSPKLSAPVKAGPVVYKKTTPARPSAGQSTGKTSTEKAVDKTIGKARKIPPEIRTAAANVLTGILNRKIRGVFQR